MHKKKCVAMRSDAERIAAYIVVRNKYYAHKKAVRSDV